MVFPYCTRFSLIFKGFPPSFDDELLVFLPASHVDLPVLLFHSSLATIKVFALCYFYFKTHSSYALRRDCRRVFSFLR